ncbi:HTH domain-containing protein [Amycolatopsis australiensis]|uniref:HTH domain-containing protein n=1 Tax=Amycolatopsis australiensis TaxID=546364 RepID=A0A1K1T5A9_9PSEU|nr:HTH domain-containing protein [Amycolatopsis australiensis]
MRLEAEFTSEPFRGEGSPPEHALAARDAAAEAGLETDFGPLGTLVSGDAKEVLEALPAIARAALDGGATQVTLQVRRPAASNPPADEDTAAQHRRSAASEASRNNATASHPPTSADTTGTGRRGTASEAAANSATGEEPAAPVGLNDALARLIADVERELGSPLGDLDRAGKQRAVRLLRERGAFGLRKSVSSVADALGVTRFTVYNYLNREAD